MGTFDTAVKKINNLLEITSKGQKTMAESLPVVVASNQGALPTTVAAGGNVTEGNTSDAAVITDTTGTLSGKLRGLVKWAFERMPASLGQKAMAASLPVVLANDHTMIQVSAHTDDPSYVLSAVKKLSGTDIGVNTTPYSINDAMGVKLTLDGLIFHEKIGVTIDSITITDLSKQNSPLNVIIYDSNPTGAFSNNNAFDPHDADLARIVGVFKVLATDYVTFITKSVATIYPRVSVKVPTGTDLFAELVCQGTPTYVANGLGMNVKVTREML